MILMPDLSVIGKIPAATVLSGRFIDFAGNSITRKLETLMEGGYITEKIEEDLTYDYLHSSEENLWSVLYLTGYLTKVRESELKAFPGGKPNSAK